MKNIFNFKLILILTIIIYTCASNAQWTQTNGPYGGRVNCFVVKGTNLFAGAEGGGVYLSTNNGVSWESFNNGLPPGCFVRAFLVSGTNLFAGTWRKGIFLSTDNGANWTAVNNGLTNFYLYCFTSINTNLFVGTEDGVFRSRDNGESWTWLSSGWVAFPDVRALSSNGETIFAATWFGKVYRSTNDGTNWTDVTNGLNGSFTSLGISGTSIFVGNYSGRVYRSTNNGDNWIEVSSGLTLGNPIVGFAVIDSNIFAATRAGVYLSTNNGANWTLTSDGLPLGNSELITIGINPNGAVGTELFVSSNYSLHSIYRSTNNGTSWTYSDSGLIATGVGALAVNNSYIFAGAGGTGVGTGMFRTTNNGEDWIEINNGLTDTRFSAVVVKENYIFAGTWGGGVFRSSDDGTNWMPVNQGLNNQVLSLEVHRDNIFAGTFGGGIFRSTDDGTSWTAINNGFDPGAIVFAIAASNEYIFAGAFGSVVSGVYRSTDNGNSWTPVNNGLTDSRISTLAFAGNNLFAGTLSAFSYGGSGVYRSTNYGASWTQVNNGLTDLTINSLTSVSETNLFAGTGARGIGGAGNDAGIFLSTDNGNNWILVNTGLSSTVVRAFAVSSNNLFIGTEGGGVWRRPLSEIIPTTTFQLSVSVANGWNMVSAPGLHPTDQNVETWWPNRTGTVWGFNGVQYVAKTVTTPGEGYWMKNTVAETYNYPAIQIVAHNPIPATLGWNMIGGYETSPSITALKAANPQITGTVWGFNGVQYVAASNLVPGYSYWVKVTAAGNITIPDVLAKGNGEIVELFKEDLPTGKAGWGRITITDATGRNYTLYAVKGEVDLDFYEMPPVPPAGMFDIRFGSGRIAEDINSSIQEIQMSGVVYPVRVKAEGMDIRVQDAMGIEITTNVKSGEEITISNPTIKKLMVSGELIPDKYSLEQNYPNPFNPSTTIQFSLAIDSRVNLKVFDTLGQEVAELMNDKMSKGNQKVNFDASKLSSGVYLYKIIVNGIDGTNFTSVRKMILIK